MKKRIVWVIITVGRGEYATVFDVSNKGYEDKAQAERVMQKADSIARARKQPLRFALQEIECV